ncbi:MAG: thioredoxin [Chloroflexota bacterium]
MSNKTVDVNQADWEREVLSSTTPVLVDFWAEWCGPCKMVAPIVSQIAEEYDGKLRVVKVDADANPDLLTQYSVMGIPTLLLMKHGEAVERIAGYQSKDKILSKLGGHI